jgi:hypothetical protein
MRAGESFLNRRTLIAALSNATATAFCTAARTAD